MKKANRYKKEGNIAGANSQFLLRPQWPFFPVGTNTAHAQHPTQNTQHTTQTHTQV